MSEDPSPYVLEDGEVIIDSGAFPNLVEITFDNGASGCKLKPDGSLETFGNYTPDEAAKVFWTTVGGFISPAYLCQARVTETGEAVSREGALQSGHSAEAAEIFLNAALVNLTAIQHDDADFGTHILEAMMVIDEAKNHLRERPLTGILGTLSPEQLAQAMSYDGPEFLGSERSGQIEEPLGDTATAETSQRQPDTKNLEQIAREIVGRYARDVIMAALEHDLDTGGSKLKALNDQFEAAIHSALLSERERCAKIAETAQAQHNRDAMAIQGSVGATCLEMAQAACEIAAAIRSQGADNLCQANASAGGSAVSAEGPLQSSDSADALDESIGLLTHRLRERLKLKYAGDCKCKNCQLVDANDIAEAVDLLEWLRVIGPGEDSSMGRNQSSNSQRPIEGPSGDTTTAESAEVGLTHLKSRISDLEEALKPFIEHGRAVGAFDGDDGPFSVYTDRGYRLVPAEDFRGARSVLTLTDSAPGREDTTGGSR